MSEKENLLSISKNAVQIQANSGLSQKDIDRMLKEAEIQKERDQKVKELAELKNEAEALIRSAEVLERIPFRANHFKPHALCSSLL